MSINEPPDFTAARDHVITEIVRFARTLRDQGVSVPVDASIVATRAMVEIGFDDRDRVESALVATLLSDPNDLPTFHEHFPRFWHALRTGLEAIATRDDLQRRSEDPLFGGASDPTSETGQIEPATTPAVNNESDTAPGASKLGDVTELTSAEHLLDDDAQRIGTASPVGDGRVVDGVHGSTRVDDRVLDRFERALATRRGRRWTASLAGERIDTRRSLRRTLGTGGVALSLIERERAVKRLRTCVLVDVSQSVLDAIDRDFLLALLSGLSDHGRRSRVFFFDTEIREVTDAFAEYGEDPGAVLAEAEVSWGGGTRIGASLATLQQEWPEAIDHRTACIVVSDGLEVDDVDLLEREMARLARRSGPIVWFNPLATSGAYEPTCRGMAVSLPFVDGLFAFGGVDDLADAARQLERHGPGGPVGYQHDFRERTEAIVG